MGRDPHRAPGRLAPLRPDYERGTSAQPPPERPPARPPGRPPDHGAPAAKAPEPPDYDDRPTYADDDYPPEEPAYRPPTIDRGSNGDTPWTNDDTQPRLRVPLPKPAPLPMSDPDVLSIQERHELLIHTISLYEDRWRLAGIQANPKTNRLQAYLLPRNRQIDLKEAISKDLALSITVDPRGSTIVKEPKSHGLFARIKRWLWGD